MRYALLSFALCAAVHAAPVQSPIGSSQTIDGRSNILLGRSGYVVERSDAELSSRQLSYDEMDNDVWNYDVTPTTDSLGDIADTILPSAAATASSSSEPAFIGEEDPELFQILIHVEEILSSTASPDEQVQWILDAIVHHTESLRETNEDLWPADEILDLVDEVLGEDASDDEKVEIIFNELVSHTKLRGMLQGGQLREPVLLRVKAVLYGPESDQQKIKGILDEIAAHIGSKPVGADWDSEQVSMVEVEEIDAALADGEQVVDVQDDADWPYVDNTMAYDTM